MRWPLGPPGTRRLLLTHALDDLGDALVAWSFAGSLFFSVSLEASRERILLYLLLTLAPLAVMAPVFGPVVARARAGYRAVIIASQVGRALLALVLAGSLKSLAFYPLAFGILLAGKVYSVAKTAIVAQLVPDESELVASNAHLARVGTVAGAAGTAVGALLLAVGEASWLLFLAAAVYVAGSASALRVESPPHDAPTPVGIDAEVAVGAGVRAAIVGVAVTKAAIGAVGFLLAFALKRGGEDEWVFGAAIVAAGAGGFAGTYLAQRLRRQTTEDRMIVLALGVPGLVTLLGVFSTGPNLTVLIAASVGVGASVASRAMESLFGRRVAAGARGGVIARAELRFQVAQIAGAAIPVVLAPGTRVGFALVAALLVAGSVAYGSRARVSLRSAAGSVLVGSRRQTGEVTLPRNLLREADGLALVGATHMAAAVAATSVAVAIERVPVATDDPAWAVWEALAADRRDLAGRDESREADALLARRILDAATDVVAASERAAAAPATPADPSPPDA